MGFNHSLVFPSHVQWEMRSNTDFFWTFESPKKKVSCMFFLSLQI